MNNIYVLLSWGIKINVNFLSVINYIYFKYRISLVLMHLHHHFPSLFRSLKLLENFVEQFCRVKSLKGLGRKRKTSNSWHKFRRAQDVMVIDKPEKEAKIRFVGFGVGFRVYVIASLTNCDGTLSCSQVISKHNFWKNNHKSVPFSGVLFFKYRCHHITSQS